MALQRKATIICLTLFVCVSICKGDDEKDTPKTAAREFISLLNDGKFKDAAAKFDAAMQKAISVDQLQALWQSVIQQNGALSEQGESKVRKVSDNQVVDTVCKFEKANLAIRVSLDAQRHVAGLFFLPAPRAAKDDPNPIQLETKTGKLFGTLDLPAGNGPWPVAVIIAGSGPTDRDGNSAGMKNDCLRMLGHALAEHGIAALRYDKRGIGESAAAGGKEDDLRFENYASDAADWIKKLRGDPRFNKVVIIGHSEGSLVGILAAQQANVDAVVSLEGAGRNIGVVLREQLKPKLPADQFEKADQILVELEKGRTVSDIPSDLQILFRPSVQPYLSSWLKYDPAKEIAKLKVPTLIVQGTTDLQTSEEDAKLLASANKNAQSVSIKNMNHVLKHTEVTELSTQLAVYADPSLPLDSKLTEAVISFLDASLGGEKK